VTQRTHWHFDWRLIVILLLMTWAGARGLNADGFWSDEWYSMLTSGADRFGPAQSPLDIWNRLAKEDPWQTPGYFIVADTRLFHAASTLGPTGRLDRVRDAGTVAAVRGAGRGDHLSVECAAAYRLSVRLSGSRGAGLGAAVALAGSAWLIHYLHELRGYTLYAFLTAALFVLYMEYMGREDLTTKTPRIQGQRGDLTQSGKGAKPQRWHGVGLFLTALGLFYTHYFAALVVVVLGFWHLTWLLKRQIPPRRWWLVIGWIGAAGSDGSVRRGCCSCRG